MWISEIKLKNFRPFYSSENPVTISFKMSTKDKFSIIEAKSDVGKTTFLSAIAWCFYGKETSESHNQSLGPFCIARKQEMKERETDSVSVEITINDQETNEPLYVIRREEAYQKINGELHPLMNPIFSIQEWENNDCRYVEKDYLNNLINSILPEDIHLFFMFEGEKLEKHFSFNNNDNIRQVIERTSQINQIKSAIQHLQQVRDKVWTSDGNVEYDQKIAGLEHQIREAEDFIKRNTETVAKRRREIGEANQTIAEIERFLSEFNIPYIREMVKKEKELRLRIEQIDEAVNKTKRELKEKIIDSAPQAMVNCALRSALDALNIELAKDKLEPNINNKYLEEILKQQKCVCGRTLKENNKQDTDAITLIKFKIQENQLNVLKDVFIDGKFKIQNISEKLLPDDLQEIAKLNQVLDRSYKEMDKSQKELSETSEKIKGKNEIQITKKQSEKESLILGKEDQIKTVARLEAAIRQTDVQLSELRQNLDLYGKKKKGGERKQMTANFIDRSIKTLKKIEGEILKEVREKVQEKTWKYFCTLHWDKEKYKDFSISQEYNLKLTDGKGTNWMHNLASGPKQLLLLSFIAALSEVSGFKFPVFIDTPFANIDNEQRENVAKKLPEYLKKNQVILLMKDQEYTPTIRSLLSNRIAQEFRFIMSKGITEVKNWN